MFKTAFVVAERGVRPCVRGNQRYAQAGGSENGGPNGTEYLVIFDMDAEPGNSIPTKQNVEIPIIVVKSRNRRKRGVCMVRNNGSMLGVIESVVPFAWVQGLLRDLESCPNVSHGTYASSHIGRCKKVL